jgi:hypothetical protein
LRALRRVKREPEQSFRTKISAAGQGNDQGTGS